MSTTTHHDDIPFDIQTEIIKRIPDAKSLIRFRSVSKPWKSLIDSSKFIAAYKSTNHHLLVRHGQPWNRGCRYVSVVDDDSFPQHNFPLALPKSAGILVGISQGLFCFYGYSYEKLEDNSLKVKCVAVVWNPSIRKSVTFGVPGIPNMMRCIGFGVCLRTKDPKLVEMELTYDRSTHSYISTSADIFTLSSGAWRSQSINLPNISSFKYRVVIDIDGILYWHATTDHAAVGRYNRIITFDLTSEEFGEVCLPDMLAARLYENFSISKLNESLVVLEYYRARESHCDVWMMDHGDSKLLKKLFTIKAPFLNIIKGFRMNGQAIIETKKKKKKSIVKVYDPCTGHTNDHDLRIDHCLSFECSYTETLLLL